MEEASHLQRPRPCYTALIVCVRACLDRVKTVILRNKKEKKFYKYEHVASDDLENDCEDWPLLRIGECWFLFECGLRESGQKFI